MKKQEGSLFFFFSSEYIYEYVMLIYCKLWMHVYPIHPRGQVYVVFQLALPQRVSKAQRNIWQIHNGLKMPFTDVHNQHKRVLLCTAIPALTHTHSAFWFLVFLGFFFFYCTALCLWPNKYCKCRPDIGVQFHIWLCENIV